MAKKADDIIKTRGLGLRLSEWEEVDKIAAEMEVKPHGVLTFAVRYFLKHWREGRIKIKTETRNIFPDL